MRPNKSWPLLFLTSAVTRGLLPTRYCYVTAFRQTFLFTCLFKHDRCFKAAAFFAQRHCELIGGRLPSPRPFLGNLGGQDGANDDQSLSAFYDSCRTRTYESPLGREGYSLQELPLSETAEYVIPDFHRPFAGPIPYNLRLRGSGNHIK